MKTLLNKNEMKEILLKTGLTYTEEDLIIAVVENMGLKTIKGLIKALTVMSKGKEV
jgi:hypothetical protein